MHRPWCDVCVTERILGLGEITPRQITAWLEMGVFQAGKQALKRQGPEQSPPDINLELLVEGKVIGFQGMFLKAPQILYFFIKYLQRTYCVRGSARC